MKIERVAPVLKAGPRPKDRDGSLHKSYERTPKPEKSDFQRLLDTYETGESDPRMERNR